MKDKFYVTELIKKLIDSFDQYLTNFPHKEIEIKREIMSTSYQMLKIAYEENTTFDIQDKIVSYIKYLDYLVNVCYNKHIINSKKYLKFGENLDYLLKYVIGWRKSSRA